MEFLFTSEEKERFMKFVEPEPMSGCWLWSGWTMNSGYGHMWFRGRAVGAHRLAYQNWIGPIPFKHDIDHKCEIRICINPNHLQAVTRSKNNYLVTERGGKMGPTRKPFCTRGLHEMTDQNRLNRGCRLCRYIYVRDWKRQRKAKLLAI